MKVLHSQWKCLFGVNQPFFAVYSKQEEEQVGKWARHGYNEDSRRDKVEEELIVEAQQGKKKMKE